jgi:hypothetical protein
MFPAAMVLDENVKIMEFDVKILFRLNKNLPFPKPEQILAIIF